MEGAASAQVMLRAKVLEVLFVRACIFAVQETPRVYFCGSGDGIFFGAYDALIAAP